MVHRYDRASLEILDRVNYVAGLIEAQGAAPHNNIAVRDAALLPEISNHQVVRSSHSHSLSSPLPLYTSDPVKSQDNADARDILDSLEINGRGPGLCEDVLEWPIFGGTFDRTRIEALIFNPSQALLCEDPRRITLNDPYHHGVVPGGGSARGRSKGSRGINEEHAPSLVERFLINVHTKNPVLEPDDTRRKARYIAETGFAWDADSCLLVSLIPATPFLFSMPHC